MDPVLKDWYLRGTCGKEEGYARLVQMVLALRQQIALRNAFDSSRENIREKGGEK